MKNLIASIAALLLFFCLFATHLTGQSLSNFIVVDQFGYLPDAAKIAVIKDPVNGYDAQAAFEPGSTYAVVDEQGVKVLMDTPVPWNNGAVDPSSGDRVWRFDFSAVTTNGTYYILDVEKNVRSFSFKIGEAVYEEVLKQAVRTFFYQRAGYEKSVPFADPAWADGASHLGPLQDTEARLYNQKNNAQTERDLHGGWYDAGDYNKYTSWTANYVVDMLKAYLENPVAWGDDYRLPDSGNGIPDLLDEVKWGLDFLQRMQNENGSVLSIVSLAHASPPSSATGQSLYGPATTSATQNTASALALAATVFQSLEMEEYAGQLRAAAEKAWDWSEANTNTLFYNNDASSGSAGIGAGQQEEDDYTRDMGRLEAACYLFEATGAAKYRDYFDQHYQESHLFQWTFAYPFETNTQEVLLRYTQLPAATPAVVSAIISKYKTTMGSENNFAAYDADRDPYFAFLKDYTWGSNGIKAGKGSMFYNLITYELDPDRADDARRAAAAYIHYLHGVNPQNLVYLSNMHAYGGDRTVNEFYHTWFHNGSDKWDRVGESMFGPAPGFVTGGPNPSYSWDACCPGGCGSTTNNAICNSEDLSPPNDQPAQKSYKDFNTSWPLNSWSVTENSGGYQVAYIRLLSKFVDAAYDCNNDLAGSAYVNSCGNCVGGDTGQEDDPNCQLTPVQEAGNFPELRLFPNPVQQKLHLSGLAEGSYSVRIYDVSGKLVQEEYLLPGDVNIDLKGLLPALYWLRIGNGQSWAIRRLVKM